MSDSRLRIARIALLAALTVVIAGGLTYYFKDYVRQVMAIPATRILWFVRLMIDSTPQILFWSLLLIILLVVGVKSLSSSNPPETQAVAEPLQTPRRARIAFWTHQVTLALTGDPYSRIRMAEFLGDLTLQVLAHQQKMDREEIRLLVLQEKLDIPPAIEACVKARFRQVLEPRPGFWASIGLGFRSLFPFFKKGAKQQVILFPGQVPGDEIEAVIHYLEEQLEVRDDSQD